MKREKETELFGKLSRYYRLARNDGMREGDVYRQVWQRPALLKEGKPSLIIRYTDNIPLTCIALSVAGPEGSPSPSGL